MKEGEKAGAPAAALASKLAGLLFFSGACALVYQVAYFREFRLIFGTSTAATGAVLAIFTAGLGAGGWIFGRRVDRHPNPAALYATLELAIALLSAMTPALFWVARKAYVAVGGTTVLGPVAGTVVRLMLSALVLFLPTLLMGGTLPCVARAVQTDDDVGRRRLGWLYGVNTLGAVAGCLLASFFLLEEKGTRNTILLASAANLLLAFLARWVAKGVTESPSDAPPAIPEVAPQARDRVTRGFVLVAAAVAGLSFFVMEIVWYRMLGPLLGGTVFTFGLILAVALFGIGLGGALYGALEKRVAPSLAAFAIVSLAEALCMAAPYAEGDRIATLALALRLPALLGFGGLVFGWAAVALLVVLPAAVVAGLQFPMLIGLLGRGKKSVGEETGLVYAANTAGGVLGSLLGGFVLLPSLGALGSWRAACALLLVLGIGAALLALRATKAPLHLVIPIALAAVIVSWLRATGPTALFRHSPIGVGRIPPEATASANAWRAWGNAERRSMAWEMDGVESTVALSTRAGLAFVVNGKVDGHIRADAPTQVMSGMVGAILHPHPKSALVIGLGTGSSSGWLGAVPEIARVDVVELEPAVLRVAKDCALVNHDVMDNPKVHITIGDAREKLLTTRATYDLVFSEPSNPYRAGIASLFTREYYQAIATRLEEGGLFLQWVQAYDIDTRTIRKIFATLSSVFPAVETWELGANDLLLVGSRAPIEHDADELRRKIAEEPYKEALLTTWRAVDLEGFLSHFVARPELARAIAEKEQLLNTDDRTLVEFAFARTANHQGGFDSTELFATARARGEDRPAIRGNVAWDRVEDARITFRTSEGEESTFFPNLNLAQKARAAAQAAYLGGQWHRVVTLWQSQTKEPADPTELAMLAEAMAEEGDEGAESLAEKLRAFMPAEADAILGRLRAHQGKFDEALEALSRALVRHRKDPWPWPVIMRHAVELAGDLATKDAAFAERVYTLFREPFAGRLLEDLRIDVMLVAAGQMPLERACVEALAGLEPDVPWRLSVLSWRSRCYEATKHPLAAVAARDVDEYLASESVPFGLGLTEVSYR